MIKLHQSFLIFSKLADGIFNRNRLIKERDSEKKFLIRSEEDAFIECISYFDMNIINACAFLDEYNNYFGVQTEKEFTERIIELKRCLKPVTKAINKWSDLNRLRNQFSAHNLRDDKNGGLFIMDNIEGYNAPNDLRANFLLGNFLGIILQAIVMEFNYEINNSTEFKKRQVTQDIIIPLSYLEIQQQTEALLNEVNNLLTKQNKNYKMSYNLIEKWNNKKESNTI